MVAPVMLTLPPFDESLDVGERNTVFPISALELIWECDTFEFAAEVELSVGNGGWALKIIPSAFKSCDARREPHRTPARSGQSVREAMPT